MKHILIIHAHWNNRGDEAAVRAIIDELMKRKSNAQHTNSFSYCIPVSIRKTGSKYNSSISKI